MDRNSYMDRRPWMPMDATEKIGLLFLLVLMWTLDPKLLRELWLQGGQTVAIVLIIICGSASFVATGSVYHSLKQTRAAYYERHRFAQLFAQLKRAPQYLAARIAQVPGVAQVETRIVVNVNLDVPGLNEPATGRLISLPEQCSPRLNHIYLKRGASLPQIGAMRC